MHFRKLLLLSLFPFLSIALFAQTYAEPQILWHKTYGGSRMDEVYQIIENMRGGLVAVGETKSKSNGGTDMFFFISDKNGNLVSFEKRKGREKDDGARSVVQTYDGGYVLAGYTESPAPRYKGQRDGWILKVDEKGITQWDQIYGGGMDDSFKKILQTPEGDLVIVGTKNEMGWIIKTDPKGQLIWEETFQAKGKNTFVNSAAMTDDGSIFLTGYAGESKNKSLLVHAFTTTGKAIGQPLVFDPREGAIGEDIYWTKEGHLVITGTAGVDERRADMCFIEMEVDKTMLKKKKFGGRGIDVGTGIIQRSDGTFAMVGDTYSHKPGARRSKLWVKAVDAVGTENWEKFEGQKREDKGFSIIETSDGSIVVAGYSTSDLISNHDPYIVKYEANDFPKNTDEIAIKPTLKETVFGEEGGFLKEEERGYLLYEVENTSDKDLFGLRVKVACEGCKDHHLSYFDSLQVGFIPANKTKLFSVPFFAKENLLSGENDFLLTFEESGNRTIPDLNSTIKTERSPQADLAIINPEFSLAAGAKAKRGETIKLKVDLKNKGKKAAEKIYFNFHFPYKVINKSEKKYRLATLGPGESKTFEFEFEIQETYLGAEVSISCRTGEKNPDIGDEQEFSLAVASIGKDQPASLTASIERERAEKIKKTQAAQVALQAKQAKIAEEKRLAEVARKEKEVLKTKRLAEEKRIKEEQAKIAEAKRIADEEEKKKALELAKKEEALAAARIAEAQQIAEEKAKIAEEQKLAEAARIEKEKALETARIAEAQRLKEEKAKIAEEEKLAEVARIKKEQALVAERIAEEKRMQEEKARIAEEKKLAAAERLKKEQALEAERLAEVQRVQEEKAKIAAEKKLAEAERIKKEQALEAERLAEVQRVQEEKARIAEAERLAEAEQKKQAAELEARRLAEEQRLKEEQAKIAEAKRIAEAEQKRKAQELEAKRLAEEQKLKEEQARIAEAKRIAEAEQLKKAQALEAKRIAEEKQQQEELAKAKLLAEAERVKKEQELEAKRLAEEKRLKEEQAKLAEAKRLAEAEQAKKAAALEAKRLAEEKRLFEEQAQLAEEKRIAAEEQLKKEQELETKRLAEEKRIKEEAAKLAEAKRTAEAEQKKQAAAMETKRLAEEKRLEEERAKLEEAEKIAAAESKRKEEEIEARRLVEEQKLIMAKAKIAEEQKLAEAERIKKEQELEAKRIAEEQKIKEAQTKIAEAKKKAEADRIEKEKQLETKRVAEEKRQQEEQAKMAEAKRQAEAERKKKEEALEAKRIAEEAKIAEEKKQFEEEKKMAKEAMEAREAALKEAEATAERLAKEEQDAQKTQDNQVASLEAQLAAMKAEMAAMKEQENAMLTIVWSSQINKKEIIEKEKIVAIIVTAVSSEPLTKDNFQVLMDGKPLSADAKYDEVDLDSEESGDKFQFTFAQKVPLQMGENQISVKVKTDKGEETTPVKTFVYAPKKPNLHLLSIGVPHVDLQFTAKDAKDFAALFANQGGPGKTLFNEVFIRSITHPDSTSKSNLEEAIEDLKVGWKRGTIVEGDYVVLFISSHGFKDEDNGGFRIKAYPFDGAYASSRSLDFKTNIIDALYSLRCKKLVFIDACNSGAIERESGSKSSGPDDKEISAALENMLNSENSFKMMASCRAQEFSYEDEGWQNGAFTKAIMEAFDDYQQKGLKADSDDNKILTLNELYNFVSLRVPEIIKTKSPQPETKQTPFMSAQQRVNDLEFYILK